MTGKRDKVLLLIAANPDVPWHELCLQAGYSKKRCRVTASELRRSSRFQSQLQAIRRQELSTAPTKETFYTLLNSAARMALRCESSNSSWILLQVANLMGRELCGQEPKQDAAPSVEVRFVESSLGPEEARVLNASAAQFEADIGAPPGFMGRLGPESATQQAQCPAQKAVPQAKPEGAVLELNISEEERKRLQRLCMPVGGALQTGHCQTHGTFECIWQQSASGEWGWSDCPRCWEKVN